MGIRERTRDLESSHFELPNASAERQSMHLTPVDDTEYANFAKRQVVEYARQLAKAGEVAESESIAVSRERLRGLLADELRPAGHLFFVARSAILKPRLGWVWVSPAPAFLGPNRTCSRWLSQITVEETVRGRGWGRALLRATERHLAQLGVEQLWLRVFDWNTTARALYDAQGYELVQRFANDSHLRKRLS
jgi:ribosomal protein S18 acetylase RimI-like enzyme